MRRLVPLAAVAAMLSSWIVGAEARLALLNPPEKKALAEAVSKQLKDPASATFKWGALSQSQLQPDGRRKRGGVVQYCGLVNAKNSYGGYTGFSPFYAMTLVDENGLITTIARAEISEADPESKSFYVVTNMCEQAGYDAAYLDALR